MNKKVGTVYSIPCVHCNVKYIGETGQSLKQEAALQLLKTEKSAIADHANNTGLAIDWASTDILQSEVQA